MLTYKRCQNQRHHLQVPTIQQDRAEELMYVKFAIPRTILGTILTNMFVIVIQIEKWRNYRWVRLDLLNRSILIT
jgi:hypothetical protein